MLKCHPRGGKFKRLGRALVWPFHAQGDVLLTIDPDTALAAYLSSRLLGRHWVADVHEEYADLLQDRDWVPRWALRLLQHAVGFLNRIITRADLVLVADEHVSPREITHRFVMRNEADLTMLPAIRETEAEEFRALYIGDNRESRGLMMMVEAVAATADDASPWHLDIVGPMAGKDLDWFEQRCTRADARNIHFHDRRPPAQAWQFAETASVGLCLLQDTPAFHDAMPSKVYEYQACGLPIIATALPRVVEFFQDSPGGVIVDTADDVTQALRRFAKDAGYRQRLIHDARTAGVLSRSKPNVYDRAARAIAAVAASSH